MSRVPAVPPATDAQRWADQLQLCPMTLAVAQDIADHWHYPPPYDFHDIDADADDLEEFLTPSMWPEVCWQARGGDEVVGFLTATTQADRCAISLGLRPDLTGAGRGEAFLRRALQRLGEHLPTVRHWDLDVVAFNRRAITVYERVGFRRVREFDQATNGGVHRFVHMTMPR